MKSPHRKKKYHEEMMARFPKGTFAMIRKVIKPDEDRTDFVRAAVQKEIERRGARGNEK